jgi:succinyl-diaminopimelate desuccinylase
LTSDPEALARLALDLVAVPSVTGEEAALAGLVEARCRALPGVAVERLGNALVARVGEVGDAVALVGHLDTVPPWEGHAAKLEGTRVIGRGAADMKGGDAAILAVL